MFVTSSEQRGGLLVAVITGGRPRLKERPTHRFLPELAPAGVADIVWVVSDSDAETYEEDGHSLAVYPRAWAEEYAQAHWMLPTPPERGGFLGAFPGREWACLEAERRGCWGVLQLDDNLTWLGLIRGTGYSRRFAEQHGGLALFTDLLAGVALSTNARTTGAQLDSVSPSGASYWKAARPGFPYSCFIERVGDTREPWYGPFEDDITHSFQYGTRADGATAAVMPLLHYKKETKSRSGMRGNYNHTRAVQLQRIFPESAKVGARATRSNGRGEPRIFHTMLAGAIRNPLTIHNHDLFGAVKTRLTGLISEWHAGDLEANRDKTQRRARQAARMTTTGST